MIALLVFTFCLAFWFVIVGIVCFCCSLAYFLPTFVNKQVWSNIKSRWMICSSTDPFAYHRVCKESTFYMKTKTRTKISGDMMMMMV